MTTIVYIDDLNLRAHEFHEHALGYRYPISWALANASVRFLAPSLRMADDR
jgi:hypothetical protein